MDKENFELGVLNLIKSVIYYQLAVSPEELFEYGIRKINYFGAKAGVNEFIGALPENHIARTCYEKLNNLKEYEFMNIKKVAFIKMIIWEIKNQVIDWDFIQDDEDVENMAVQITNTDISNVEDFIKNYANLLEEDCNRYKYYFALLYDYLVAQKESQISKILKKELNLFEEYDFHDIYKFCEDEFYFQDAEDERSQYLDLINRKLKSTFE